MKEIIGLFLVLTLISLAVSICLGLLEAFLWLLFLPVRLGWWLIKLPFKILFG